jgi:hypothetical protein
MTQKSSGLIRSWRLLLLRMAFDCCELVGDRNFAIGCALM